MQRNTHTSQKKHGAPLGQHFLTRPEIAGWVASAVPLTHKDTVLEIGPGHGILTRELLMRAGRVIAIEKDPLLVAELQETFREEIAVGHLILVEQDIRDFEPSSLYKKNTAYSLVANIPYYLTGYIIRKFLSTEYQPTNIAVLIQKEVAERIVARNNKESLLSLSVKAYGTPELVRTVKAGAFSPPPKVDSAILHIRDISRSQFLSARHETQFFELLRTAFSARRKTLGATLKGIVSDEILGQCAVPKTARPEDVRLGAWLTLSQK
ncbi:MAG: ribosomal RNA small subunit methyltransferase A [Candidatus Pacebacteria bacterium]|nr:ribosomal RNA small subunit methyltransferase A [Candidatus Paceibacterota bacterium]